MPVNPFTLTSDSEIAAFLQAAAQIAAKGLVRCSSGNLSQRLKNDTMLIKASRAWMESLAPDQLAVCRISDGERLEGAKPSVETALHAGILRTRPDARVVLHFQSPFATAAACRSDVGSLSFHLTPEVPYYIGSVGIVPFLLPGSPELAEAVAATAARHRMIVLRNHGQVTFGATFEETIQQAVFFEMTCEFLFRAENHLCPLDPSALSALMAMRAETKPV
jgi:ribulose-5-phosphate 4-epimerase/fuculose-1-phosphate aldolase